MLYINFPSWITPEVVPGFFVRWYALMYIVAFYIAYMLTEYQLKKNKATESEIRLISDMVFTGIIFLLIGARLGSALIYSSDRSIYLSSPIEFLKIFWPFDENMRFIGLSGMSYHGGVVGAAVGLILFSIIKKVDFFYYADIIVASIPLGYTFGRLGNFINGELYGKVTKSPIGMIFPNADPISLDLPQIREIAQSLNINTQGQLSVNLPRYPSQLFEAFSEGILVWALLWFVFMNMKLFKGAIASLYVMLYAIARFIVEYFRGPDEDIGYVLHLFGPSGEDAKTYIFSGLGNISMGQVLSFIMFIGGLMLFVFCYIISPKKNIDIVKTYKKPKKNSQ